MFIFFLLLKFVRQVTTRLFTWLQNEAARHSDEGGMLEDYVLK